MTSHLLIIAIVGLIGNIAIADTFNRPWAVGILWTVSEIIAIAVLFGSYTILTA